MNEPLDLLLKHVSIRRYKDESIPEDHIHQAVLAGQAASTSSAVQAYSLLQVTDKAERQKLVSLTGGQTKVANCGAFFVICGDTRRHRLICEREGQTYEARTEAFLLSVVDASLFAQNLVIAFESMGYGICYIGGLRNQLDEVDELLELPHGVYPLYGLCVGVPDEKPMTRPRLPVDAVLFKGRYPTDIDLAETIDDYDETYREYMQQRTGKARPWSTSMSRKFSEPQRVQVGDYYRRKGADLT